jgi:serine/threonine-protein kinase
MRQNGLIGRQVAGRFTIKRFLGEGGMATVYVAEQAQEPKQVALKIMNDELNADRTFVKRFQREAKAAARVQHPNSVQIIDYGVSERLSYIAMELLEGDDLYVLLEREGAIAQGRAARILVEVCDALMVAHELGIVHRDLKPENIMVMADPSHPSGERVKVLDFGIAKLLAPDTAAADPRIDPTSAVTRAGTFIGTPAYMSPEQCALLPVDTRADIYTCGVLLFQLVTGRLPFEGQTPLHTATLHIHEQAPRPSSVAPAIDQRLEAIIMKALAKKPTDRHQTARHLASTLRKILPDLPDVAIGKVAKPQLGSLRLGGPRSKAAPAAGAPATPAPAPEVMESAKTMVASNLAGPPPSVVLRNDGAPSSDDMVDSAPARIRPAARVPAPAPIEDDDEAKDSEDSDDSMRTLVRAPASEAEEPQRFGPKHTEVIMAAPTPTKPVTPVAPASPAASPPGAPPRRIPKPTLKSAVEFKPSEQAPDPELPLSATEKAGSLDLDAAPLALPVPVPAPAPPPIPVRVPGPDGRISVTPAPPERSVVVVQKQQHGAFAETAKVPTAEELGLVPAPAVSGTAQTVPLISPALVASVIAAGPPKPNVVAGPPQIVFAASSVTAPLLAPALIPPPPAALAPPPAPLPQTPPIYPLAPLAPDAGGLSRISGARGLLIGFFAGALIMALVAIVYLITR